MTRNNILYTSSNSHNNSISVFYITDANNNGGINVRCKPPGNPKCNIDTWKIYGGYSDHCCTNEQQCYINEGDCDFDSECLGSLVCLPNSCPEETDRYLYKEHLGENMLLNAL